MNKNEFYCPKQAVVSSVSASVSSDTEIPRGTIQVSIGVPENSSVDIDGVTYTGEVSLNLGPMSYAGHNLRYPKIILDNVVVTGGDILLRYEY